MDEHKVITTDAEIDEALAIAKDQPEELRVIAVEYKTGVGLDIFILKLNDGHRFLIPREDLEGLQDATPNQIAQVEILGNGTGLHWKSLDLDFYVPNLLRNIYGTRRWMAQIGRRGGLTKSTAKQKSSRVNGLKGGRPKFAVANF
jgi:hypothetical protein